MVFANTEEIVTRLMADYGYPRNGAQLVALKLGQLQVPLAKQVEKWWVTHEPIMLEVEGHSVETLKRDHGLNDIAAILTLDWLIRDPNGAQAALARGHDSVEPK